MELYDAFDPVRYSELECEFLIEHLGEPPVVAERHLHKDLAPKSVMDEISRVYALLELDRAGQAQRKWLGVQACKDALSNYIFQVRKWRADWVRTKGRAPLCPPMYSFDSKGKGHLGGPGSDSGIVKTYFDENGNRIPFALDMYEGGPSSWVPDWANNVGTDNPANGLKNDPTNSRIECLVCGHTEKYNTDSRSSYNAARGRISKHLRSAKDNVDEHRATHTNEFGG